MLPNAAPTIAARNIRLSAAGDIGVDGLLSASSGTLALSSTGGAIQINPTAILGAQTSLALAAQNGVTVAGGTVHAPSVSIGNTLALTSGSVFGDTVTLTGPASVTGGLLHASTLNTNGLTFSAGDLYAGNDLPLSLAPSITGRIATSGALTATGSDLTSTADIYALHGAAITLDQNFHQASGTVVSGGNLTVTAGGLALQDTPGHLEAGGTLLLRASGTGPAAILGQLAGNQIQLIEPNAQLTLAPSPLRGAATVSIGPLLNSGLTSTVTAGATTGPYRPATLRLDGSTLALNTTLAADAIELHSQGATTQAGSPIETALLTGTAGYTASTATLRPMP